MNQDELIERWTLIGEELERSRAVVVTEDMRSRYKRYPLEGFSTDFLEVQLG